MWIQQQGFSYWHNYPKKYQTEDDINSKHLYKYSDSDIIKAVITLDESQFYPWSSVHWSRTDDKPLVVHRLAVHPEHQNRGLGKILMQFAEDFGLKHNNKTIRLDVSADNKAVNHFYISLGYAYRGSVYLPVRDIPFNCYDKSIS